MNPFEAAQRAGWWHLGFDHWLATDSQAILSGYYPIMWRGTARDLCLAHGIDFE